MDKPTLGQIIEVFVQLNRAGALGGRRWSGTARSALERLLKVRQDQVHGRLRHGPDAVKITMEFLRDALSVLGARWWWVRRGAIRPTERRDGTVRDDSEMAQG